MGIHAAYDSGRVLMWVQQGLRGSGRVSAEGLGGPPPPRPVWIGPEGRQSLRRRSVDGNMASRAKRRAVGSGAPRPPGDPIRSDEEEGEDEVEDEEEDDEDSDPEEDEDDEVVDEVRSTRDPSEEKLPAHRNRVKSECAAWWRRPCP